MTANGLVEALRQADPTDDAAIAALSRSVVEQAFAPIRKVVALVREPDVQVAQKASTMISNLGELAMIPVLESPQPKEGPYTLWKMETVMALHLETRDKVVAWLDSMLADKTPIKGDHVDMARARFRLDELSG